MLQTGRHAAELVTNIGKALAARLDRELQTVERRLVHALTLADVDNMLAMVVNTDMGWVVLGWVAACIQHNHQTTCQ